MVSSAIHHVGKMIRITSRGVIALFLIRFFILEIGQVNGASMEPHFNDNDFFLVEKVRPLMRTIKRHEIIQLQNPEHPETILVKRVVGLPGEAVVIKENRVWIQPKDSNVLLLLEEPYLDNSTYTRVDYGFPNERLLGEDEYYVIGDNRDNSTDSRQFGPVHRKYINGIVIGLPKV